MYLADDPMINCHAPIIYFDTHNWRPRHRLLNGPHALIITPTAVSFTPHSHVTLQKPRLHLHPAPAPNMCGHAVPIYTMKPRQQQHLPLNKRLPRPVLLLSRRDASAEALNVVMERRVAVADVPLPPLV